MNDIQRRNDVVLAWHGVDGDAKTFWAEIGPVFTEAAPVVSNKGILDSNSFAAPAMDPSARVLATVGPASPSPIRLRTLATGDVLVGGPVVPSTIQTTARPAVASDDNRQIALAWRRSRDGVVAVATQSNNRWSTPVPLAATSHGPAVAFGSNQFVVAWKGAAHDNQIYGSVNGGRAKPMRPQQGGMLTSDSPALCWGAGNFWMVWKGVPGDEQIWFATSRDGLSWTTPIVATPVAGGIRTISSPGLALWQRGFVLAWRGVTGDQQLWWSTLPLRNPSGRWQTPTILDGSDNSNAGPTLGSCQVNTL